MNSHHVNMAQKSKPGLSHFPKFSSSATLPQQLHIFSLRTWIVPSCSTEGLHKQRLIRPCSTCPSPLQFASSLTHHHHHHLCYNLLLYVFDKVCVTNCILAVCGAEGATHDSAYDHHLTIPVIKLLSTVFC